MKKRLLTSLAMLASLYFCQMLIASDLDIPNQFQAGTAAIAAEVNANFTATKTAVDDNHQRLADLEIEVATLRSALLDQGQAIQRLINQTTSLQNSEAQKLSQYLIVDELSDPRGPKAIFSGINLQLVNGLDASATVNGLGNLLIGYDEERIVAGLTCSIGIYETQQDCENNGGIWTINHKSGSHNIVVGPLHNYSGAVGIVSGSYNNILNNYTFAVGYLNRANNLFTSISGGQFNKANGENGSVSGGSHNVARGQDSSVSGGTSNIAQGLASSVSGGLSHFINGFADWQAGTLFEDQ